MKNKILNIDIISYFLKYFFLLIFGILIIIGIINLSDFLNFIGNDLERRLCIYASIQEKNNLVSDFLLTHNYDVFGSDHSSFLDGSTNILSITIFLRIFEITKYFYFAFIIFLIFVVLNRYSKNKLIDKLSNKWLLVISILIILIPFICLIKDFIGCTIINSLPVKKSQISFKEFNFTYLFIGFSILSIFISNHLYINNKSQDIYLLFKKILSIFFILIFSYYLIINFANLINTAITNEKYLDYYELVKVNHYFISILTDNSFEIFGRSWDNLGYYTNLRTPILFYYIFQIFINIFFICIFTYDFMIHKKRINTERFSSIMKKELLFFINYLLSLLLNMIAMLLVINEYNDYEYHKELNYSIINIKYIYYIVPSLFILISSINFNKIFLKEEKQ